MPAHSSSPESDGVIEVIHTLLDIDESDRTGDIEGMSESDSLELAFVFNGERTCPHSRTRFPIVVGLRRTCCFRSLIMKGRAAYNAVRSFSCTHVGDGGAPIQTHSNQLNEASLVHLCELSATRRWLACEILRDAFQVCGIWSSDHFRATMVKTGQPRSRNRLAVPWASSSYCHGRTPSAQETSFFYSQVSTSSGSLMEVYKVLK